MSQGPVVYLSKTEPLRPNNHGLKISGLTRMQNDVGAKTASNTVNQGDMSPGYHAPSVTPSNGLLSPLAIPDNCHDTLTQKIRHTGAYHASADPLIINTVTPPLTPRKPSFDISEQPISSTASSPSSQPSPLRAASQSFKSIFRRNVQQNEDTQGTSIFGTSPNGVGDGIGGAWIGPVVRNSQTSQPTSTSNSPRSSSSPFDISDSGATGVFGTSAPLREAPKPGRTTTGRSLKERIKFAATSRPRDHHDRILRSPSLGNTKTQRETPDFAFPANSGVGLKARRMSASLPEDFHVDSCELSEEFVSASKIPGRRGKEIGKGATATVKIMYRKGCSKDIAYAVKEFRKRGRNEMEREYEQKVKSEFSIASSLHHPNIVKTVRLCSHAGRWNHVMEYCSYGDLYSLIQRGYLQKEDNLCLFRQLLQGVAYLHENGIAHRDIKLENLLLSSEGHLKITDFGVSEVFSGIHPGLRSAGGECGKAMGEVRKCSPGICGSLPYIAPEVLAKTGT